MVRPFCVVESLGGAARNKQALPQVIAIVKDCYVNIINRPGCVERVGGMMRGKCFCRPSSLKASGRRRRSEMHTGITTGSHCVLACWAEQLFGLCEEEEEDQEESNSTLEKPSDG